MDVLRALYMGFVGLVAGAAALFVLTLIVVFVLLFAEIFIAAAS